jgi:hypothetical protein
MMTKNRNKRNSGNIIIGWTVKTGQQEQKQLQNHNSDNQPLNNKATKMIQIK